jgi:hypothetical protein
MLRMKKSVPGNMKIEGRGKKKNFGHPDRGEVT